MDAETQAALEDRLRVVEEHIARIDRQLDAQRADAYRDRREAATQREVLGAELTAFDAEQALIKSELAEIRRVLRTLQEHADAQRPQTPRRDPRRRADADH
jgi:hypothetical protein